MNDIEIFNIALHNVGNKSQDDPCLYSKVNLNLEDELSDTLSSYFLTPFSGNEYFHLYHEADVNLNEVYAYATKIFDDPECLHEQSVNLAKHLYEKSTHPKIKAGEFYVVYFKGYVLEGEIVDAIGLFKSENKDTFLKVYPSEDRFTVESQQGVNINKLDKGCLIFNTEKDDGYVVAVVDNTNKTTEAHYWIDEFLHVRQRQDEYFNTQSVLSLCKSFVTKDLPLHFDMSKADQADLLNKSVKFFKEKDSFDIEEFKSEVIEQPEVIDRFNQFKGDYQIERDIEIADTFNISESAVKKQSRSLKSIIKLDKNFHIYVHGDKKMIENGEDSKGKFYKVYYNEES